MNKAIFFDRDGVLNREIGDYVTRIEDFELLPDAVECIQIANQHGFLVFVITNQGGIDKQLYTIDELYTFHNVLIKACEAKGATIQEIFFCSHHPLNGNCICRKPDSVMLEKAIAKYNIDVKRSIMFGDTPRDIEAAEKVHVKGVLVQPNTDKISLLIKEIQRIQDN